VFVVYNRDSTEVMQAFPTSATETDNQGTEALNSLDIVSGSNPIRKSLWHGSSQYRNWRYSRETLRAHRTQINEVAVSAIKGAFEADEVRFDCKTITSFNNTITKARLFEWHRISKRRRRVCFGEVICGENIPTL
jgi:hypothetical protein